MGQGKARMYGWHQEYGEAWKGNEEAGSCLEPQHCLLSLSTLRGQIEEMTLFFRACYMSMRSVSAVPLMIFAPANVGDVAHNGWLWYKGLLLVFLLSRTRVSHSW